MWKTQNNNFRWRGEKNVKMHIQRSKCYQHFILFCDLFLFIGWRTLLCNCTISTPSHTETSFKFSTETVHQQQWLLFCRAIFMDVSNFMQLDNSCTSDSQPMDQIITKDSVPSIQQLQITQVIKINRHDFCMLRLVYQNWSIFNDDKGSSYL